MQVHADPRVVIVGGVSGSGKSTVGRLLATKLNGTFYEGDDYHSPDNIGAPCHCNKRTSLKFRLLL